MECSILYHRGGCVAGRLWWGAPNDVVYIIINVIIITSPLCVQDKKWTDPVVNLELHNILSVFLLSLSLSLLFLSCCRICGEVILSVGEEKKYQAAMAQWGKDTKFVSGTLFPQCKVGDSSFFGESLFLFPPLDTACIIFDLPPRIPCNS